MASECWHPEEIWIAVPCAIELHPNGPYLFLKSHFFPQTENRSAAPTAIQAKDNPVFEKHFCEDQPILENNNNNILLTPESVYRKNHFLIWGQRLIFFFTWLRRYVIRHY